MPIFFLKKKCDSERFNIGENYYSLYDKEKTSYM